LTHSDKGRLAFSSARARLPRFRKAWMSEDYRMSIFDAAAFATTYFHFSQ
jgi:hypothetical protein